VVKLQLLTSIRIHPVVNISQIVWYREQVERQKTKEVKPVEIDGVEEWKVEKILIRNKGSCEIFDMMEGVYSRT